ncbi:Nipped-B-like protein A [Portunus trituberculatus]|uniref:Nipped-B-like protein A n=1 Tax=Portunus trituberculatus TaxID=210409 RepID=A0A5B7K7C4_PORTR|nr:Nipped-B-like protein A [Portunus trituberculatus]
MESRTARTLRPLATPNVCVNVSLSLRQVLPELPLPSSSVGLGDSRSLLFHPRVAEEAQRLLACQDPDLVQQLANSLARTHADHM